MGKTPKRLNPKPKTRKHLPSLNTLELEAFKARLASLTTVSQEGKEAVMLSMLAAANPNAETPEMVIKTLDPDMQREVMAASQGYQQTMGGVQARGAAALMMDFSLDDEIASQGDE